MSSIIDQIKSRFKSGSMNLKLMMVNIGVFVTLLIVAIIGKSFVTGFSPLRYLAVSSNYMDVLTQPWTIITYMFSHSLDGIGHLFWNMLLLYFMGNFFESILGSKKLLSVYLIGGLAGLVLFILGYNFLPALSVFNGGVLVGASAAVTAIFVAIGVYMPNYEIRLLFIPQTFKLIYVVAFFVLLDIIRLQTSIGVADANTGGWLAHIGGAIFGVVYASQLKKGKNILSGFEKFIDYCVSFFKPGSKLKVKYSKKKNKKAKVSKVVPRDDYDYNESKVENQKKTDAILDKISKAGYESLSKAEKDFLFRQSNN